MHIGPRFLATISACRPSPEYERPTPTGNSEPGAKPAGQTLSKLTGDSCIQGDARLPSIRRPTLPAGPAPRLSSRTGNPEAIVPPTPADLATPGIRKPFCHPPPSFSPHRESRAHSATQPPSFSPHRESRALSPIQPDAGPQEWPRLDVGPSTRRVSVGITGLAHDRRSGPPPRRA